MQKPKILDDLRAADLVHESASWYDSLNLPDVLTESQRIYLFLHYEWELSQAEIAKVMGFSYQRASALEHNALRNLRRR